MIRFLQTWQTCYRQRLYKNRVAHRYRKSITYSCLPKLSKNYESFLERDILKGFAKLACNGSNRQMSDDSKQILTPFYYPLVHTYLQFPTVYPVFLKSIFDNKLSSVYYQNTHRMDAKVNRKEIYQQLGLMGIPSTVLDELTDDSLQQLYDAINRAKGDTIDQD
jgi:hypothetical protein